MCGITLLWGTAPDLADQHKAALDRLKPRGPDISQTLTRTVGDQTLLVGFARLHIQGTRATMEQPFSLTADRGIVMCNGEIFNAEILVQKLGLTVPEGASDCAILPALIERGDLTLAEIARQLDGDFAIVWVDMPTATLHVARDPYGVRPLYYAEGAGWRGIASELKGFPTGATHVDAVLPGTTQTWSLSQPLEQLGIRVVEVWHQPPWLKTPYWHSSLEGLATAGQVLRQALEEAVAKRLQTVRDVGACLSGGLDSSLVAAIAARRLARKGKKLHTFSIGMEGSADLTHARLVAAHIGSIHHERIVTPEACLEAIPAVIRAVETFDITTVRASVGNWLVGKMIREETPTIKVILNGDGSDEALGGYLYMRAAPDEAAFEAETDRLLREIHRYDVARSERSMAAHGLESRSPFLDRQFVAVARSLPTEALRPTAHIMEKMILRSAFADTGLLPEKVLWRRKEAFSDGISRADRSWFEMAREEGTRRGTSEGENWQRRANRYTVNPPPTAEALWYRELFHSDYPETAAAAVAPTMWMPRFIAGATDPSARTLALYTSSEPKSTD